MVGLYILVDALEKAQWDDGWEYRGMGQFGPAASVLDARLIALSRIADGSERKSLLRLLGELTPGSAFSHFRAVSLLLRRSPCAEAVAPLTALLETPELTGTVETSLRDPRALRTPDGICLRYRRYGRI